MDYGHRILQQLRDVFPSMIRGGSPDARQIPLLGEPEIQPVPQPVQPAPLPTPDGYVLQRSARRRRTIQISVEPDLIISVIAPMRLSKARIDEMVALRMPWITRRREELRSVAAVQVTRRWQSGETLPWLGGQIELQVLADQKGRTGQMSQVGDLVQARIPVSASEPENLVMRLAARWYVMQAQRVFNERAAVFAETMGVQPRAILVRNQERRWGSCTRDGTIRLCWRLVMAPMPIIDYVIVHELSHIGHPHHQKAFWDCVADVLPDYRARRAALKRDGEKYRF